MTISEITDPRFDSEPMVLRPDPATFIRRDVRFADPEVGALDDIVDLARYPIDAPESDGWAAIIASIETQLATDGCVVLRGFLNPAALAQARDELAATAPYATIRDWSASVYARSDSEIDLPVDDPRRVVCVNRLGHVTRDQFAPNALLTRLYVSPIFKAFVAACVGERRIFEYADPLAGLIATIIPPGGSKAWHYDTNEYVVTIMTQAGDQGGDFDFSPNLRRPGDENLDGLRRVLTEEPSDMIVRKSLRPGDLQLFLGRYSLHRVTQVDGHTERHVAVLSYANRPGVIGPVDRTRAVYGRVTEAHLIAEEFPQIAPDGLIV